MEVNKKTLTLYLEKEKYKLGLSVRETYENAIEFFQKKKNLLIISRFAVLTICCFND